MIEKGATIKKWIDTHKLAIIKEWDRRHYVADVRRVINKKYNVRYAWDTYKRALVRFRCIDSPLKRGIPTVIISMKEQKRLYKMRQNGFSYQTIANSANSETSRKTKRKTKVSVDTIKAVIAYMDDHNGEANPDRFRKE